MLPGLVDTTFWISVNPRYLANISKTMIIDLYRGNRAITAPSPSNTQSTRSVRPMSTVVSQPDPPQSEKLTPTPELLAELVEMSAKLETASPQEILRWTVERFAPRFTMATAFGPEGMCLIHMLAEIAPQTPIFNLDTGYQFAETLELRERVLERYGIAVQMRRPDTTVEEYEQLHGGPVYKVDTNKCCADRKLAVQVKAIEGMHAWASAIRRDQSPDRAQAPIVGWDRKFGLVKVSPLANWTKQKVWGLLVDEKVPYNPLHDQGYMSIGCWPCTRATMFGEDERAGRWSGSAKTECGLHSLDPLPSPDSTTKPPPGTTL